MNKEAQNQGRGMIHGAYMLSLIIMKSCGTKEGRLRGESTTRSHTFKLINFLGWPTSERWTFGSGKEASCSGESREWNGRAGRLDVPERCKRAVNIRRRVCIMSFFSWLLCWPKYHVIFITLFNLSTLHFFGSNMGMLVYATKSDQRANVRINNPWSLIQPSVPVLFVFWQRLNPFKLLGCISALPAFSRGIFMTWKS